MPIKQVQPDLFAPIFLICLIGTTYLLVVAFRARKKSYSIDGFFLGGRNIGAPLSAQAFWGSSFSLANGVAFFAVFGYLFGLSAVWLQIPWCLSICFIAFQLDRYLPATDRHTVHGFLGDWFGPKTRILSAIVTMTGFLGFLAYEVNISSEIVLSAMGARANPELFKYAVVALSLAGIVIVAVFCDVAGYSGIARTDRVENRWGLGSVILIIILLYFSPKIPSETFDLGRMTGSLFDFSSWSMITTIGVLCYAFTINLVDMSHWQTISANAALPEQKQALKREILKSAVWTFFLPGLAGAFFGYVARDLNVLNPTDAMSVMINLSHLDTYPIVAGIILGLTGFGLFCTSFSTAKNYLMAGCQVLSWDILHYEDIRLLQKGELSAERSSVIVERSRPILYGLGIASVTIFIGIRFIANNDEKVFATQFLMTGAAVALVPACMYALFFADKADKKLGTKFRRVGFGSIICGFVGSLAVFLFSVVGSAGLDAYAWGPIVALITSGSVLGLLLWGRRYEENQKITEAD